MEQNYLEQLPNELIEYIFSIIHRDNIEPVLNELKEHVLRTELNRMIAAFVDTIVDDAITDAIAASNSTTSEPEINSSTNESN